MKKLYVYNLKRHTLHIEGLCPHTFKGMKYGENYKCFETEDDAIRAMTYDMELECIRYVADYYAEQGEVWYPWDG